ncbi:hypothetical protein B4U80_06495 [Leptotrombidium deliense]|uniref:Thymidylate kinase n=1 Tax=Leptotrombidium deliense TaxID=299467 RepID=A0A443SPN2_9ACAR|nr:hypothetical protein B4U80_06495 [Leptotrombidium deliense]
MKTMCSSLWRAQILSAFSISIRTMTGKVCERGALICVEGVDRVGKSTLAKKLVETLSNEGLEVRYVTFPNRETVIGKVIDEFLKGQKLLDDHSIHLLFSANRWEVRKNIEKQMLSGTTLIVDRYAFSGVAYSAAKNGMNFEWCKSSDIGLPKPDVVLYLTAPETVLSNRSGFGDEIYERNEFQAKVKSIYERLKDETWLTFVNDKSVEEMHSELLVAVKRTIANISGNEIEKLWLPIKKPLNL